MTSPQRILERAIEVLEEHGEAGIRTHQIAEDCGVTAPILYRAFRDREGLIEAAQAERYRRNRDHRGPEFREALKSARSREEFRSGMARIIGFMISADRAPVRRFRASVLGSAMTRPNLAAEIDRADTSVVDAYVEVLGFARERGWIAYAGDLAAVVYWWIATIDGRTHVEMAGRESALADWDGLFTRSIMSALFGDIAS